MTEPREKTDRPTDLSRYFKDRNILVVEDRVNMLRTMKNMLRNIGVPADHILSAPDGREAMHILNATERATFVLLDLHLPVLSGIEVLKEMAADENLKDMPVLVVTADNHEDMVGQAFEAGAKGYLIKPFNEDTLREKITNIINPAEYLKLFAEVEQLIEQAKYEEAIELSKMILEVRSDSPGAYVLRGRAYEGLHMDQEALASYEKAHRLSPIYLRVINKLIDFHLARNQFAEAFSFLEKADTLNPHHARRKIQMGRVYLELGQGSKAEKAFDKAVEIEPELVGQVSEDCLKRRPDLAEKYCRQSLAVKEEIYIINQLGMALRAQGKWAEAVNEYKWALDLSPNDGRVFYNMGRAYLQGEKRKEALSCFQKAVKLDADLKEAGEEIERLLAQDTISDADLNPGSTAGGGK